MDISKLTQEFDERLKKNNTNSQNGALYQSLCKQIALACFRSKQDEQCIFYLSESHAASLRMECMFENNFQCALNTEKTPPSNIGLNMEYVSFHGTFMEKRYQGLRARLKEMPQEWTLVQITLAFNQNSRWVKRLPGSESTCADIHIVNYSCGDSREPCHVMISKPENNDNDILLEIHNVSVKPWIADNKFYAVMQKQKRIENSAQLKSLVNQVTRCWLKEWSCLLLGKLQDTNVETSIRKSIDDIISKSAKKLTPFGKVLLYQIACGCAHLNESEIQSGVSYVVKDNLLQKILCEKMNSIKDEYRNLIRATRHPVILILDQDLEGVPWEMTPILRIHPVSRIPSIHFLHALYKKHEKHISEGNVIISDPDAYFIINPEQNLNSTEKRVAAFIKDRFPNWRGSAGTKPEKDDFADALTKYDLFIYCGHGSGSQYFRHSDIVGLQVKAIPLIMGCSSFQHKSLGGRVGSYSLCSKYIMAGSPAMLGALWPVTSTDTDNMTITLLNHWLPGSSIDLKTVQGFSDLDVPHSSFYEPELLRILKNARELSLLYSNQASLVVYGLPIKICKS